MFALCLVIVISDDGKNEHTLGCHHVSLLLYIDQAL